MPSFSISNRNEIHLPVPCMEYHSVLGAWQHKSTLKGRAKVAMVMFRLENSSVLDLEMALGYDPFRIEGYLVGREYIYIFLLAELAEKKLSYPLDGRRSTALLCNRCPFFSLIFHTLARKKMW